MRLQNNLNKDLQLARLYRSIAVLFELATIYAVAWTVIEILKWAISWI